MTPTTQQQQQQQLNNIINALVGFGDFATWLTILSTVNTTHLPVSATLLVPQDAAMDLPSQDPFLFPYHVVPQRLTFSDLLLFPCRTRLPTLLRGKSISVTDNSPLNFSLDATPITHPDLFSTPNVVVHGIHSFLNYSLFGDGIPPSPPFLPIGDAIGTEWNSGGSSSRLNDVVFFSFCFVLGVLVFFAFC
ncbi:FAS1 domain-containing protein SELMODRAFT_448915-like [Abrus precatorius]|uniref:FAS1 domain-containing protein SELMODRAFT_448915-like n=1 Tax=Abrus precatorius TaxID=3816 RepID=A0A8B8K3S4_ABRPR|nr:FAS1 domain-containing protein SELMODRAFT_448915-like [Abrus precatorius]